MEYASKGGRAETAVRIYLARHGQCEWQLDPSQDLDSALTPIGHEQAKRMSEWLANRAPNGGDYRISVASLCASPLRRAQETAAYAASALSIPVITQDSLREATFHVADHLPSGNHPLDGLKSSEPSHAYLEFQSQARTALHELVSRVSTQDGPVLAVTHGGLLKTLLRVVLESGTVCFRLFNASLTEIEWRRGRWHLVHLNLCEHLPVGLRTE